MSEFTTLQRPPSGAKAPVVAARAPAEPERPKVDGLPVQPALKVGAVDDPAEREADRIADTIMRMPSSTAEEPEEDRAPMVQRMCSSCHAKKEDEDDGTIARKPAAGGSFATSLATPSVQAGIADARRSSVATSLSPTTRGFFEDRLARPLPDVRVHADATAAGLASKLDARAFTIGRDVFFASGEYRPETNTGRRLLAHELVHTLQQTPTLGERGGRDLIRRAPTAVAPARADTELGEDFLAQRDDLQKKVDRLRVGMELVITDLVDPQAEGEPSLLEDYAVPTDLREQAERRADRYLGITQFLSRRRTLESVLLSQWLDAALAVLRAMRKCVEYIAEHDEVAGSIVEQEYAPRLARLRRRARTLREHPFFVQGERIEQRLREEEADELGNATGPAREGKAQSLEDQFDTWARQGLTATVRLLAVAENLAARHAPELRSPIAKRGVPFARKVRALVDGKARLTTIAADPLLAEARELVGLVSGSLVERLRSAAVGDLADSFARDAASVGKFMESTETASTALVGMLVALQDLESRTDAVAVGAGTTELEMERVAGQVQQARASAPQVAGRLTEIERRAERRAEEERIEPVSTVEPIATVSERIVGLAKSPSKSAAAIARLLLEAVHRPDLMLHNTGIVTLALQTLQNESPERTRMVTEAVLAMLLQQRAAPGERTPLQVLEKDADGSVVVAWLLPAEDRGRTLARQLAEGQIAEAHEALSATEPVDRPAAITSVVGIVGPSILRRVAVSEGGEALLVDMSWWLFDDGYKPSLVGPNRMIARALAPIKGHVGTAVELPAHFGARYRARRVDGKLEASIGGATFMLRPTDVIVFRQSETDPGTLASAMELVAVEKAGERGMLTFFGQELAEAATETLDIVSTSARSTGKAIQRAADEVIDRGVARVVEEIDESGLPPELKDAAKTVVTGIGDAAKRAVEVHVGIAVGGVEGVTSVVESGVQLGGEVTAGVGGMLDAAGRGELAGHMRVTLNEAEQTILVTMEFAPDMLDKAADALISADLGEVVRMGTKLAVETLLPAAAAGKLAGVRRLQQTAEAVGDVGDLGRAANRLDLGEGRRAARIEKAIEEVEDSTEKLPVTIDGHPGHAVFSVIDPKTGEYVFVLCSRTCASILDRILLNIERQPVGAEDARAILLKYAKIAQQRQADKSMSLGDAKAEAKKIIEEMNGELKAKGLKQAFDPNLDVVIVVRATTATGGGLVVASLDDIPTHRSGEFAAWFDSLSAAEVAKLYENQRYFDKITDQLRGDGEMHEFLMVAHAPRWKSWGVTTAQVQRDLAVPIHRLNGELAKGWRHSTGTKGVKAKLSGTVHKELEAIIQKSDSLEQFIVNLRPWADRWINGGYDRLIKELGISKTSTVVSG